MKTWFLALALATTPLQTAPAGVLVIRDVRLFDGERVIDHRSVVVRDGKIRRIIGPKLKVANAELVEGRGRTLLPGLFDAHVHLPMGNPEAALHEAASFGVTTVLDMFNGAGVLKKIKALEAADPPDLADVRGAGYGAIAPDSIMEKMMNNRIPAIKGPEEAQSWVDARIAEGSDYIKIVYDDRQAGPLTQETVRAIVQAAHRRGKLVVVHVLAEDKARGAIEAGADGLAHLFLGGTAGSDFGRFAADHHVFVIPTLTVLNSLCGSQPGPAVLADPHLAPFIPAEQRKQLLSPPRMPGRPGAKCTATVEAMGELIQAHVPILAGTDTGFAVGPAFGAFLQGELKLLVDAGMTPVQALTAATSAPAKAFHLTDRGLIRPGMRADLLLVEGDPTQDILATRSIVAVWKKGMRIERQEAAK